MLIESTFLQDVDVAGFTVYCLLRPQVRHHPHGGNGLQLGAHQQRLLKQPNLQLAWTDHQPPSTHVSYSKYNNH